jgi:UDP-GlcNAc:undecaprenyl-phosphate/decaprenyl-phosphate GlcNAc-1-phosphate transferase
MSTSLWIAIVAFALSLGLTPVAGLLARKLKMLDHPDEHLKKHKRPIPYLGGLAVYAGFIISLVVFKIWESSTVIGVVGVITGTSVITLLGVIDDKAKLSPQIKFVGQIIAAGILIVCNMHLQFLHHPVLSVLLSVIWVVGIVNAMNLIDIMDGLSSGVSAIAAVVFFMIAAQNGRFNDMYILAAFGGAVLGFLPYNFPKAKIYLGDTGALLLGFVLASIAMGESYSRVNPLAILAPILILGVPIFDTLFIMFLRHRRGVSMFRGSPDHLALRMVKLGLSKQRTVLLLWGVSAVLGLAAYVSIQVPMQWSLMIYLSLGLVALFVAERLGSFPMEPKA